MAESEERRKSTFFPPITQFGIMKFQKDDGGTIDLVVTECPCGYRICVDSVINEAKKAIMAQIVEKIMELDDGETKEWGTGLLCDVFGVSVEEALAQSNTYKDEGKIQHIEDNSPQQ
jgi:hypothetical protein